MELFQDLLCTFSLSLLVSLLLAKLFSVASSFPPKKDTEFEDIKVKEVCDFGEIGNLSVFEKPEVSGFENSKIESVGCVRSMTEITPLIETTERCEIEVEEAVKGDDVGDEGFTFIDNDDEDGWEGIERTELEKEFWAAVAFLASKSSNAGRIGLITKEVKMQLFGLYKVATDGPCRELQPMALKVTARAIWNAWKRVGDIAPVDAMEQYIVLLSQYVPDWMRDDSLGIGTTSSLH